MLVNAVTGKGANGKKKKPPLGLDTHMLNNRTAAAAGLGKRGTDTKACLSQLTPRLAEGVGQSHVSCNLFVLPFQQPVLRATHHRQAGKLLRLGECAVPLTPGIFLSVTQAATSATTRAGLHGSFTSARAGSTNKLQGLARSASGPLVDKSANSEASGPQPLPQATSSKALPRNHTM